METDTTGHLFLERVQERFQKLRSLGEGALEQLDEAGFHYCPDASGNSIAVIVKHLHGNMVSRWTDFLVSDGNKPWRDRDGEFVTRGDETAEAVRGWWDAGWDLTLSTLESLEPRHLGQLVTIRGVPLDVLDSILRQHGHYNYHVGQIVYLARGYRGDAWRTLSIARGMSEQYIARPGD